MDQVRTVAKTTLTKNTALTAFIEKTQYRAYKTASFNWYQFFTPFLLLRITFHPRRGGDLAGTTSGRIGWVDMRKIDYNGYVRLVGCSRMLRCLSIRSKAEVFR